MISINTVSRENNYYLVGMKVLAPLLLFSDTISMGDMMGCLITAW